MRQGHDKVIKKTNSGTQEGRKRSVSFKLRKGVKGEEREGGAQTDRLGERL